MACCRGSPDPGESGDRDRRPWWSCPGLSAKSAQNSGMQGLKWLIPGQDVQRRTSDSRGLSFSLVFSPFSSYKAPGSTVLIYSIDEIDKSFRFYIRSVLSELDFCTADCTFWGFASIFLVSEAGAIDGNFWAVMLLSFTIYPPKLHNPQTRPEE